MEVDDQILWVNDQEVYDRIQYLRQRRRSTNGLTTIHFKKSKTEEERVALFVTQPTHPSFVVDKEGGIIAFTFPKDVNHELSLGDRIIELNGETVTSSGKVGGTESRTPAYMHYSFDRSERGLPRLEIGVVRTDARIPWIHILLGSAFLILGTVAYRLKPMRKSTWGFFIFCCYMSVFFFLRGIPAGFRNSAEFNAFYTHLSLAPAPSIILIGTFTPIRRWFLRFSRLLAIAMAIALVVLVLRWILDLKYFFIAWGLLLLAIIFCVSFMDKILALFGKTIDATDLQRSTSMRLALIMSFVPNLLYSVIRMATGMGAEFQIWFEVAPFFFPAIISYAIVRQNFLRINELLLEGAVFSSLMIVVGGSYGLVVGSVVPLLDSFSPGLSPWATGVLTGLLACVVMPVYARVRRRLEQYYEKQQARYDELIHQMEIDEAVHASREEFCTLLVEKLRRLAESSQIHIVAYFPQRGQLECLATSSEPLQALALPAPAPNIIAVLERHPDGIYREELEDSVGQEKLDATLVTLMSKLQAIMLFPILVENRLSALLAVGNKVTRRNFSRAEIEKLKHVARCMTVGFYGFAMQRRMMEKEFAESALMKSEERLKLIADNAQDVIYRFALLPVPSVEYVSPSVERITGISPTQFMSDPMKFFAIIHPEDVSVLRALLVRMPTGSHEIELRWISAEGRIHWTEQRIVPVWSSDGQLAAIEGIARDVTERKLAQEKQQQLEAQLRQSQKLEAVGTLASGIAHDIGNLLTAISGFTSIARTTLSPDHPASDSLQNVEEAVARAGGISKSLLTFTKEVKASMRPINLTQLTINSLRMLRRFLPATILLEESLDADDDIWILADENQIHQVFFNLILNARDAMPDGGRVSVELQRENSDDGTTVRLIVEDSGHGIPEELREKIFEPFFTTKSSGHGTGLGLSVTHGIVTQHGGSVSVGSSEAGGARFEVLFDSCPPPDSIEEFVEAVEPPSGAGELVLVAEDDPMIRQLVSLRLKGLNYDVVTCADGEEWCMAFEKADGMAAAAILDVDLPKRSGLDCLKQIRSANPQLPVILITANPSEEIENTLDSFTMLLRKPFPVNALADLLSRRTVKVELEAEP